MGHGGQVGGLDLRGVIDASGYAVRDQLDQRFALACGRVLEQLDQLGSLIGGQGKGGYAKGSAFCDMAAVGFKHGIAFEKRGEGTGCGTVAEL